jgi:hypothetical protein
VPALRARLPAAPPLDPDPDQARQWLQDELSKDIYHRRPSLLDQVWQWFQDLLTARPDVGSLPPWQALGIGLAVLAIIIVVAWRVAGPLRRRAAIRQPVPVLDDEPREAGQLRAAARERAAAGDWRAACRLAFQALARRLEDRAILDHQPGRTARELALDGGRRLPALDAALGRAAEQFDAIAYGDADGGPAVYQFLTDLGTQAEAAKPVQLAVAPEMAVAR